MKRILFTAAAAGLTLAAAPVASADHRPGHQGGGSGNLTLVASAKTITFGKSVTLSGKLTGPNAGARTVTVREDPFPFDNFTDVVTATTDAQGDYSVVRQPTLNTRYQARSGSEESGIETVLVRPRITLALSDRTPRSGQRVRFFGRVCPEHDGRSIAIQRRFGDDWRTVRSAVLTDDGTCSAYSRRIRVRRDGTYRAVLAADADHATGVSPRRTANVP
jgi:hypothetical protein